MGAPLYKHFGDLAGNPGPVVLPVAPCFNFVTGGPHAGNKLAFRAAIKVTALPGLRGGGSRGLTIQNLAPPAPPWW